MLWLSNLLAHHNVTTPSEANGVVGPLGMGIDERRDVTKSLFALHTTQFGKFAFQTSSGRMGFAWQELPADARVVYIPYSRLLFVLSEDGRRFLSPAWIPDCMGDSLATVLSEDERDWEMFYLI